MGIDAKKMLVGAPDQSPTTGAVQYADTTATLPTDATTAAQGFTSGGFVSEDGLVLNVSYSTKKIRDWSKKSRRTLLEEFTCEVTFTFAQTDYDTLVAIFGESNVSRSGDKIHVAIGSELPPARAWVFNMKDGEDKARLCLQNAQPVLDGDIAFVADEPIKWPLRLSCDAGTDGKAAHIYVDDATTTTTGA